VTGHDLAFLLVALVTGGSALLTVTSKNLVHAALFLAATLSGIAGVFLVLAADFVALVQVVVYVGAVAVLFLFGLMLTRAPIGREALDNQNRGMGIAVAGGLFVVLSALIIGAFGGVSTADVMGPRVTEIGIAIFAEWVLPFEVLSMLLLAALIGAILLARRETGDSGEEQAPTRIEMGYLPSMEAESTGRLGGGEDRAELTSGAGEGGA
jgi:NADH-quinone oxidoreductase subunit J